VPALLLFLLLHGVLFHDVLFDGRSLSASTLTAGLTSSGPIGAPSETGPPHVLDVEGAAWVDEPSPYLAHGAFMAGELPLWNPRSGLGAPLAANLNSGAGNPLQWPLDLWPSPLAADLFHLGRLLLLAWATWLLLRELMVGSIAAFVGAAIVAYGGYPMSWIVHHPLSSELFLPLMLYGFERGRRGREGGWVILAAAAAGSLFGGKLQASLLCFAFVGAWSWVRAAPAVGGRAWATIGATALGLCLGVVLAAFLLAPAVELMARASGLTLGGRSQLASFTVPWSSLASLAAPGFFAAPGRVFPDGLLMPAVGTTALVLAAVGVVARASPAVPVARLAAFWAIVFLLRNVGAFGELATSLPIVRGILFVKYTFTVVFALAIAAAIGLDAILARRVAEGPARRAMLGVVLVLFALMAASRLTDVVPTDPARLAVPAASAALVLATLALWRGGVVGRAGVGSALAVLVIVDLVAAAPHEHPPRLDPYQAPPYVAFLREAGPGRILADADLAVPLTSAAAGLSDLRAIDVLTPGAYYAFFMRLVSFCDRVIHFTVDPDVPLAATAPALDLAGVRWIVTRGALDSGALAARVRSQVGHERTAQLLAGMVALRTEGGPLAIGRVAVSGADERFAFTLPTPFTLDVTADTEAAEIAWDVLVRGGAAALRTVVDGVPSDASTEPELVAAKEEWREQRISLARAGERRRIRVRISAVGADATPATVSLGNLGFGPGAMVEARLAGERGARHAAELASLREAFRDPALGVVVYENTNALPRTFRVGRVEPTGSADAAFTRLGDGFDFRNAALVDKAEVAATTAALGARVEPARDGGVATISGETPNTVTIATDGSTGALLVLADLAYPGWRVAIDDQEARVLTVDGVLRGVVVPAGSHVVTFRYRPATWLIGGALSMLGLVALVPYGRIGARRHRGGAFA
jgi:hypothetical protein